MATARELQDHDPDGSVNRSYYAMFDIARAALLSAGVREDELPRTHSGLIGSFSKHAVLSGRIDQKLFAALGRAESLRLIGVIRERHSMQKPQPKLWCGRKHS